MATTPPARPRGTRRIDQIAAQIERNQTQQAAERWLTFEEAAAWLAEYGIRVSAATLERLADYGRPGAMPSSLNFKRRQVLMSRIVPWLRDHGYIEKKK